MTQVSLVDCLKAGLLAHVRAGLVDSIVAEALEKAEKDLREQLQPRVERLTLGDVEQFKNTLNMREELKVTFNWNEGESE